MWDNYGDGGDSESDSQRIHSYRPVTSRSPGFLDNPISRRAGSSTALLAAWHELASWVLPAVLATGLCVLCSTTLLGTVE